eukprot:gene36453-44962_t
MVEKRGSAVQSAPVQATIRNARVTAAVVATGPLSHSAGGEELEKRVSGVGGAARVAISDVVDQDLSGEESVPKSARVTVVGIEERGTATMEELIAAAEASVVGLLPVEQCKHREGVWISADGEDLSNYTPAEIRLGIAIRDEYNARVKQLRLKEPRFYPITGTKITTYTKTQKKVIKTANASDNFAAEAAFNRRRDQKRDEDGVASTLIPPETIWIHIPSSPAHSVPVKHSTLYNCITSDQFRAKHIINSYIIARPRHKVSSNQLKSAVTWEEGSPEFGNKQLQVKHSTLYNCITSDQFR